MTERLFAWTFDPEAFHRWIISQVIRGTELDVEALRATAAEVFFRDDSAATHYFEALGITRDDPESWESTFSSDPDVDAKDELYALAMAAHLRSSPDISPWAHDVAVGALRQHGWEGDPSFLWRGHGLETLAAQSGNATLARALARARRSLGGWLSVEEARVQVGSLDEARSRPLPADPTVWFRGTIFGTLAPSELTELVRQVLAEFSAVMRSAVDRGEAVRLVLWS